MLKYELATPGSSRAMSTGTTSIEFFTELIDVISDGLDLVSDSLDLFKIGFQFVYILHNSFHPGNFIFCTLYGISGAAARISDRLLC